ncbi:MAG: hypothetical protein AAFS10_06995 [Myxococcota bacterium]
MGIQHNQEKMESFKAGLKAEGLFRYLPLLKGGTGAVQLQHTTMLKEKALRGPDVFKATLIELGVEATDVERLVAFLMSKLEEYGGLPMAKTPSDAVDNTATDAWRRMLADPEGRLPEEFAPPNDLETAAPQENMPDPVVVAARLGLPAGTRIVNDHMVKLHGGSIREQGMYKDGNSRGYIHLAGEVERPRPFLGNSQMKKVLLHALKEAAQVLKETHSGDVLRADVFDAFMIPPGSKEGRRVIAQGRHDIHIAEFDTAILVECTDVETAMRVRASHAFAELKALLDDKAQFVHCMVASNPKRIDDVDHTSDGVFLFNYFYAAEVPGKPSPATDILLGIWEYTAGWWTAKANLTNSAPLQPIEGERSQYSLINHCRWNSRSMCFPTSSSALPWISSFWGTLPSTTSWRCRFCTTWSEPWDMP